MQPASSVVPSWVTARIAAIGVILGAGATALASVIAANRKIREVELGYQQRLQDTYLENARAYTNSVYVPIIISLGKLSAAYDKSRLALTTGGSKPALIMFATEVHVFGDEINKLFEKGAAAFLTTALERELELFLAFIEDSQGAKHTTRRAVMSLGLLGYTITREVESNRLIQYFRVMSGVYRYLPIEVAHFDIASERILAAPPDSRDFDLEFNRAMQSLRALTKEVTLGAQARH